MLWKSYPACKSPIWVWLTRINIIYIVNVTILVESWSEEIQFNNEYKKSNLDPTICQPHTHSILIFELVSTDNFSFWLQTSVQAATSDLWVCTLTVRVCKCVCMHTHGSQASHSILIQRRLVQLMTIYPEILVSLSSAHSSCLPLSLPLFTFIRRCVILWV